MLASWLTLTVALEWQCTFSLCIFTLHIQKLKVYICGDKKPFFLKKSPEEYWQRTITKYIFCYHPIYLNSFLHILTLISVLIVLILKKL